MSTIEAPAATVKKQEATPIAEPSAGNEAAAIQEAFAGRIFEAALGTLELFSLYLGDRLGLYRSLADHGPATADALSRRAGIDRRYAREWLEQQAVAGILTVDDQDLGPDDRRYAIPDALTASLLEDEHPAFVGFMGRYLPALGAVIPSLVDAYRTGGGVEWSAYGADGRQAQEMQNRPFFVNDLPGWLEAMPDVHRRLQAGGSVADVCCGGGWLAISVARTYPNARVLGFDSDESSIAAARHNAAEAGVADRVRFEVADVSRHDLGGPHDLVVVFESLHDLARPVETLGQVRSATAPGGVGLVVDERTDEAFSAAAVDPMQRFFYAASLAVCLPNAMAERPSAATGTVMRPATLQGYARGAGYERVDILPNEHPFFRAYRLVG
jgi:2-polyprenyl-3-methyl-5-hydroxy-6-metoxy-1,4-benzoquinol methylase